MGWFKKREDVVDLGERYRRQQEKLAQLRGEVETIKSSENVENDSDRPPTFFQGLVNAAQENASQQEEQNEFIDLGQGIENKRQKLTKRLLEMTSKMEDLSNQIYHLTQRIELIERKMNISR